MLPRFHYDGKSDYDALRIEAERVASDLKSLERRCRKSCRPKGLRGKVVLRLRKRILISKIRKRHDSRYNLFLKEE